MQHCVRRSGSQQSVGTRRGGGPLLGAACAAYACCAGSQNISSDRGDRRAHTLHTSTRYQVMAPVHVRHYQLPTVGPLLKMPGYLFLTRDRRRACTQLMASEHPYVVQTRRAGNECSGYAASAVNAPQSRTRSTFSSGARRKPPPVSPAYACANVKA